MKGSLFYRSGPPCDFSDILARVHYFCNSTESTIAYNVDHALQKEIEVNISFFRCMKISLGKLNSERV